MKLLEFIFIFCFLRVTKHRRAIRVICVQWLSLTIFCFLVTFRLVERRWLFSIISEKLGKKAIRINEKLRHSSSAHLDTWKCLRMKREQWIVKKVHEMMMISGWEWMNAKQFINFIFEIVNAWIDEMQAEQCDEP